MTSQCFCSCSGKDYLVRVKYQQNKRFVRIPKDELNLTAFLDRASKELKIDNSEGLQIRLIDNESTPIHPEMFGEIVQNFWNGSGFYIQLLVENDFDAAKSGVTPDILEKYLIDKNASHLFVESKQLAPNKTFGEKSRRQLVNHLVNFMHHVYGMKITKEHKISTAKAAIILFPCMKVEHSVIGGIDLLYNPTNGGYMSMRMKNQSAAAKRKSVGCDSSAESCGESCAESSDEASSGDETLADRSAVKDCFESLKYILVNEKNRLDIERKLQFSRAYRNELLKVPETDLLESFPYFFADPKLILFEYSDTFKEIDNESYIRKWPIYGKQLEELMCTKYASSTFHTQWAQDIHKIFILLKLFPMKCGRKPAEGRETFDKSIEKLIVFKPLGTPPTSMIVPDNTHPYIIAYGSSMRDISRFYIEVERNVMPMPDGHGILETFDLLFKIHKVFDLSFEKNLKNMFFFVQHFIYKQPDKEFSPSNRMTEVFNNLSL